MATDTPSDFRSLVLYQVYVRNHSPQGGFAGVEADLERIRSMGVDVVYFLPIHPIGKLNKKGSLGCPYSISDYRSVNPEYGTLQEFKNLVQRCHQLGMKVMIDVVFNHTAHDSLLVRQHPEWFHQNAQGIPVTTVPEWSDVIDLKHPNRELTAYLVETLKYWVEFGVDGFRCDVASLLPLAFWEEARREVSTVREGVIWLAESVHTDFIIDRRAHGLPALSDGELYSAFDITYDYDIWPVWQRAMRAEIPLSSYLERLRLQDSIYPVNALKLRCVENHDQERIMAAAPGYEQALAWTAFSAFNRGPLLIYAGQESAAVRRPSLFDVDQVDWADYPLQDFVGRVAALKKHPAQLEGRLVLTHSDAVILAYWLNGEHSLAGIFNTSAASGWLPVNLPDGEYTDWLSGETVKVHTGKLAAPRSAWVLECQLMENFFR